MYFIGFELLILKHLGAPFTGAFADEWEKVEEYI